MDEQLIETWNVQNRINLCMLDALKPAALGSKPPSKGRNAGQMFAHMHSVRLIWLKSANPALLDGLDQIEKEQSADKELLRRSLEASGQAIETLRNGAGAIGPSAR